VRDLDGRLVAMVSVSGPTFRFDEAARTAILEPLRETAEAIERHLVGGRALGPRPLARLGA
jgi:DNA-binding IclR family transcriptional regulator